MSDRIRIKNKEELQAYLVEYVQNLFVSQEEYPPVTIDKKFPKEQEIETKPKFGFDFSLLDESPQNTLHFFPILKDWKFECDVYFDDSRGDIELKKCTFDANLKFDTEHYYKFKFYNCHFKNKIELNNVTFKELVDFYGSTFYKPAIFYKTNFLKNVVFAEVKFYQNALFTYTSFEGSVIFRQTLFKHKSRENSGLDLSLALFDDFDRLNMFDIELNDYGVYKGLDYHDAVTKSGDIPLNNKRETFRLIKKHFEDIGDIPSSLKFKKLEKAAYKQEITSKYGILRDWSWKKNGTSFLDYLKTKSNRFILWANSQSNDFGLSYLRAGGWILFISLILVYAQMLLTGNYIPSLSHLSWSEGFNYYFQFIDPFHNSNYMGEGQNSWFYILDFIGRAVIAYLIFQFVQAFRKYR